MSYCGMDDDDDKTGKTRNYTQQCALKYNSDYQIVSDYGCTGNGITTQKCHKSQGRKQFEILKNKHGLIRAHKDSHGLRAYYLRPYEYSNSKLCNLFSTDIILLGNVNDCNRYGIPKVEGYTSSSYIMPPPTGMLVDDSQEMHGDMGKNFRTFLSGVINNVFNEEYEKYSDGTGTTTVCVTTEVTEKVNIKMGEAGGGDEKTLKEIFYGKNGNSDALYTLGLVFDSNDIFPNVSDLSGELNNTDKIDYTGVVSQLMTVYRKNCYEHIFSKPTFMGGNTDVMGSKIKSKATCCIGTGTCSSGVCETTGYIGPILYNTCNNYFEYDKEATSYCTGFTGGVTIRDGLLYILTANSACQKLCDKDGLFNGDKISRVGGITQNNFLAYRIECRLKQEITKPKYDDWLKTDDSGETKKILYDFSKSILDSANYENGELLEISGIDWGYNPFNADANDKTVEIKDQVAGHFLEIGCMFSLSNIKSCVNLQRICEIGSEMSQTHFNYKTYYGSTKQRPSGVITKKEISDRGIRSIFATLNSCGLETEYDEETGFFKYKFIPYQPVSFDGSLFKKVSSINSNYKEVKSNSYIDFRFGLKGNNEFKDDRFLIDNVGYYLPQYRNSFYFYFGLKDGSTAIDRLYSEYYATCSD